jgi:hypothetical protein
MSTDARLEGHPVIFDQGVNFPGDAPALSRRRRKGPGVGIVTANLFITVKDCE